MLSVQKLWQPPAFDLSVPSTLQATFEASFLALHSLNLPDQAHRKVHCCFKHIPVLASALRVGRLELSQPGDMQGYPSLHAPSGGSGLPPFQHSPE